MRFHIESYGCTMNQGEAELLRRRLISMGHVQAEGTSGIESSSIPDLNIIFTCVVIQETERRMFRRVEELADSGCPLLISGCMVTAFSEKSREMASGALLVPPDQLNGLNLQTINELLDQGKRGKPGKREDLSEHGRHGDGVGLSVVGEYGDRLYQPEWRNKIVPVKAIADSGPGCRFPLEGIFNEEITESEKRSTFIVPISQGCLGNCAYCITKIARGRLKSYGKGNIVEMVENAVRNGYREIQITSQDTGIYGWDIDTTLPDLMNHLVEIPGDFRIRIGMMNPAGLRKNLDELIHAYSRDKIFKFLHLPVQSGDDGILRSMKRGHTIADFRHIVKEFRKVFPDMVLSTDIIVGYPGEDEVSFRKNIDLLHEIRADLVNITRYSERPGTAALYLPKKVHGRISNNRSRELSELRFRISREINAGYIHSEMRVLVTEKGKPGSVICRDDNYRTIVLKEDIQVGKWHDVEIVDSTDVYLLGKRI